MKTFSSLKEIAIIENNPIYTMTLVYILHSLEYSWIGYRYLEGTRELWYPRNVFHPHPSSSFTEYVKILVDPVHKYFSYSSEIFASPHKNTSYKKLLELL